MRIYNIYSYVHKLLFHRIVITKNGLTKNQRHGGMKVQRRPPWGFLCSTRYRHLFKGFVKAAHKGQ